jgi:phospholipid transport system transporter-binding protein
MFTPASAFTHETAARELAAGLAAIESGQASFTFSQTTSIDSSAVACMLAWKRHAQQRAVKLEFQNLPANLTHMIQLYGVAEFL